MGMNCYFVAFPPRKLGMLEDDPELAGELLTNRDENVPNRISIGKAWDALHFALTGYKGGCNGTGPLANAIAAIDGRPIGNDLAFGKANLLTADQVREISQALQQVPAENLERRYKAGQFRDHPPHGAYGGDPEDLDDLDELQAQLSKLCEFYQSAAERGDCVITVVT